MIQGFIQLVSQNQSLITLFFTALVAISTVVYAVLTWRLVKETKMVREAQVEPRIAITLEPDEDLPNLIIFRIENIGLGPAYKVKLNLDPDFEYDSGKYLSNVGFIKNGISYIAPKQQINFFLTSLLENFDEKITAKFKITLNYTDCLDINHEDNIWCDFSQFKEMQQLDRSSLYRIANSLERIENKIS